MNTYAKVAIVAVVGAAVIYWTRTRLVSDATANTRGVTRSAVGGNFSDGKPTSNTTPIKTAAFIALNSTLDVLRGIVGGTGTSSNIPSSVDNLSGNPRMTLYTSPTRARAALQSPTANVVQNFRASTYIPK